MAEEFKVGDLVQLRTGQGPRMIVDSIERGNPAGEYCCLFWAGAQTDARRLKGIHLERLIETPGGYEVAADQPRQDHGIHIKGVFSREEMAAIYQAGMTQERKACLQIIRNSATVEASVAAIEARGKS